MSFVDGQEKDRARRRIKAALIMLGAGLIGLLAVEFVKMVDPFEWADLTKVIVLWFFVTAVAAPAIGFIVLIAQAIVRSQNRTSGD